MAAEAAAAATVQQQLRWRMQGCSSGSNCMTAAAAQWRQWRHLQQSDMWQRQKQIGSGGDRDGRSGMTTATAWWRWQQQMCDGSSGTMVAAAMTVWRLSNSDNGGGGGGDGGDCRMAEGAWRWPWWWWQRHGYDDGSGDVNGNKDDNENSNDDGDSDGDDGDGNGNGDAFFTIAVSVSISRMRVSENGHILSQFNEVDYIAPEWTLIYSISPAFSRNCEPFFCHLLLPMSSY